MTEWQMNIVQSCRVPVLAAVIVAMRSCLLFWQGTEDIQYSTHWQPWWFWNELNVCVLKWELKDMNGIYKLMRKLHGIAKQLLVEPFVWDLFIVLIPYWSQEIRVCYDLCIITDDFQ